MMQVENEVGVLRDSRDRSPAANRAFAGPVPAELMQYLGAHKDALIPEFARGLGGERLQEVRNLGRGVRPGQARERWSFRSRPPARR